MKYYKHMFLAILSAAALSALTVGCERTVSHNEETKVKDDGTVKTESTTVTENADGTVTKTEQEKKTEPVNP